MKFVNFAPQQAPPSKWRPKNGANRLQHGYNSSPRPAAMAHNQFVNHPKSPQRHTLPPRYAKITPPTQTEQTKRNTPSSSNKNEFFDNRVVIECSNDGDNTCSALANTKMRIVKKMSEINFDNSTLNGSVEKSNNTNGKGTVDNGSGDVSVVSSETAKIQNCKN